LTSSTTETSDDRRWLSAGVVGSPHGLDGSFHVGRPNADLLGLGAIVFVAGTERVIARRAGTDARPIVRLEGCADRTAAERLRGEQLRAARERAPELGGDEWWAEELEGCTVADRDRAVGTVARLLALPSCEVLEVVRPDGGPVLLIPLVRDAVRSVDVEQRMIDVDLRFLGES
jgi:16S rRNA processing protein RimM